MSSNMRRWHEASREGVWAEITLDGVAKQGYVVKTSSTSSEEVVQLYYMEDDRLFIIDIEDKHELKIVGES